MRLEVDFDNRYTDIKLMVYFDFHVHFLIEINRLVSRNSE